MRTFGSGNIQLYQVIPFALIPRINILHSCATKAEQGRRGHASGRIRFSPPMTRINVSYDGNATICSNVKQRSRDRYEQEDFYNYGTCTGRKNSRAS